MCAGTNLDYSTEVDSGQDGCAAKLQSDFCLSLALEGALREDYVNDKRRSILN